MPDMKLEVNADWLTNEIYITAWYEHNDLRTKPTECTIHRTCIDELIAELQKAKAWLNEQDQEYDAYVKEHDQHLAEYEQACKEQN